MGERGAGERGAALWEVGGESTVHPDGSCSVGRPTGQHRAYFLTQSLGVPFSTDRQSFAA